MNKLMLIIMQNSHILFNFNPKTNISTLTFLVMQIINICNTFLHTTLPQV